MMGPGGMGWEMPGNEPAQHSGAVLQWGRDQLVAEMAALGMHRSRAPRFNGAATNWSRKFPAGPPSHRLLIGASMGPRPIGRGNLAQQIEKQLDALLQWGRDQLVAEIRVPGTGAGSACRASMGPRPIGRGNSNLCAECRCGVPLQWGRDQLVAEILIRIGPIGKGGKASMGPRPIGRGNPRG